MEENTKEPPSEANRNSFDVFQTTPSVSGSLSGFDANQKTSSWDILRKLFERHPEYGGGLAKKMLQTSIPPDALSKYISEWTKQLGRLFDPEKAKPFHGKLLILGLAHLDPELAKFLEKEKFIQRVESELIEPIDTLLRDPNTFDRTRPHGKIHVSDTPVFHTDGLATEDELGRIGFVEALERRLRRIWKDVNDDNSSGPSYTVLVDGPWGCGKSTVLQMLGKSLRRVFDSSYLSGREWIVIDFNAWKNQRLDPPWWPLLDSVYQDGVKGLKDTGCTSEAKHLKQFEKRWRQKFLSGNFRFKTLAIILICGALLLVLFYLFRALPPTEIAFLSKIKTFIDVMVGITGLSATIGGVAYTALSRWVGPSAESAKQFEAMSEDPMGNLKKHFLDLIEKINKPIIVFIDDLDRCHSNYTVELLEGIQTLFNNSKIFYVIAADQRWLTACFETEYTWAKGRIHEPGRPLGRLFLEKAFQLEVSIPGITEELKKHYLKTLLKVVKDEEKTDLVNEKKKIEEEFSSYNDTQTILNRAVESTGNRLKDQIRRQVAVASLANQEVEEETEQFLLRFRHLMESNPRSIKRLLQSYGMNLAVIVMRNPELVVKLAERQKLVKWTIMDLRWPELTDLLREDAFAIDLIKQGTSGNLTTDIKKIIENPSFSSAFNAINGLKDLEAHSIETIVRVLSPRI